MKPVVELTVDLPDWVAALLAKPPHCGADEEKMRLAIDLSRRNVENGGGPFGAAIFDAATGELVSAGVNSVLRLQNSVMHAEVLALMLAESRYRSYTLNAAHLPALELFSSCEPCAMCLGAILWSGVRRLVCGAGKADASRIGFDEGPVFPESYEHLRRRGVQVQTGMLADEARTVLEMYRHRSGVVYNG